MKPRLEIGLLRLAELMKGESEPWWIIGSTAMVLSGIDYIEPDDIDVVADGAMLRRILSNAGVVEITPKPHEQFQSMPYTRMKVEGGTDLEFQGNLALFENGVWTRLTFASRIQVSLGNVAFYIPRLDEQLQIFRRFGRAKDLRKADIIESFLNHHSP
jgi:hypothetical protein